MLVNVIKQIRPNLNVEFFEPKTSPLVAPEVIEYMKQNYIANSRLLVIEKELDQSGLQLTISTSWENRDAYSEFFNNDETIRTGILEVSEAYRAANNILVEVVSEEEL